MLWPAARPQLERLPALSSRAVTASPLRVRTAARSASSGIMCAWQAMVGGSLGRAVAGDARRTRSAAARTHPRQVRHRVRHGHHGLSRRILVRDSCRGSLESWDDPTLDEWKRSSVDRNGLDLVVSFADGQRWHAGRDRVGGGLIGRGVQSSFGDTGTSHKAEYWVASLPASGPVEFEITPEPPTNRGHARPRQLGSRRSRANC